MNSDVFSQLFDIGKDVLFTSVNSTTKAILAQFGDSTKEVPESNKAAWWQHTGFTSRPSAPTQGNSSCQALVLKSGSRDIIFATRDTRGATIYGNLKEGETCVYASKGQARVLLKADGSVTRLTTSDNTAAGTTISDRLGPDGWRLTLPWGEISFTSDGISLSVDGAAALTLTPAGIAHLIGTQVAMHGSIAAIVGDVCTTVGPKPIPTPGIPGPNSAMVGLTGIAAVPSTNVYISLL
jgi:hypothetical protein